MGRFKEQTQRWVGLRNRHRVGLRNGWMGSFINIKDMYNNDVGKGGVCLVGV
jgi:hypothetical protein